MNKLYDLNIHEVSIVGKAANGRRFLLFKDEEGGKEMELEVLLKEYNLEDEDMELLKSMQENLSEEQIVSLAKAMSGAGVEEEEEEEEEEKQMKTKKKKGASIDGKPVGGNKKVSSPSGNKFVPNKACKSAEDILKSVPEDMKDIFSQILKSQEELQESNERLSKENAEYKEKQAIAELKEIVKKDLGGLPVEEDSLVNVLKSVKEKDDKTFTALSEILGKLNNVVTESNLFKEFGSSSASQGGGAWEKIEQLAKGIVQKDAKMTMAQAVDQVLKENPKLYEDYEREKGGVR